MKNPTWRFLRLVGLVGWVSLSSCEQFEYSPHQVTLQDDEENLNEKAISRIAALNLQPSDTVRFLFISDTQRAYDETEDFVTAANKMNDIDFVLHGGDISDFGTVKEFRLINDRLRKLQVPYVAVIGNHDALGNGKKVYTHMYGPYDFSFAVAGHKFIFLNTNSIEFNKGQFPKLDYLRQQLADSGSYTNALVIAHAPPFDQTTFDQAKVAEYTGLLRDYRVPVTFYGHLHRYELSQPYNDGVRYALTDNMADRSFLKVTLIGKEVTVEKVDY